MAEKWPELPRHKSKAEILEEVMDKVTTLADQRIETLEAEVERLEKICGRLSNQHEEMRLSMVDAKERAQGFRTQVTTLEAERKDVTQWADTELRAKVETLEAEVKRLQAWEQELGTLNGEPVFTLFDKLRFRLNAAEIIIDEVATQDCTRGGFPVQLAVRARKWIKEEDDV